MNLADTGTRRRTRTADREGIIGSVNAAAGGRHPGPGLIQMGKLSPVTTNRTENV